MKVLCVGGGNDGKYAEWDERYPDIDIHISRMPEPVKKYDSSAPISTVANTQYAYESYTVRKWGSAVAAGGAHYVAAPRHLSDYDVMLLLIKKYGE